jgi:hypothetical protein
MEKDTTANFTNNSQIGNAADLWNAYSKSLDVWIKSFDAMQEAATNAFKLYLQGFEQATRQSNFDEMKKYNELWQNVAKQFEQYNPYSWSIKAWDDMWKDSGFVSFKSFADYWQQMWQNFAKDAETKSQEALKELSKQNKP